jgi:vancomycin permeability regulator SanA
MQTMEPVVRRRWWRRPRWLILLFVVLLVSALFLPYGWIRLAAGGHLHAPAAAPTADVAIVFGAQLSGGRPMAVLAGRLRTAAELVAAGKARVLLISGDAAGDSGDEIAAMTEFLLASGVDRARIVADPYGLDTYETCARAGSVYGVTRALLVTQDFHLRRAVTLCRDQGIDAEGVYASCDQCPADIVRRNAWRDVFAGPKAAWEAFWDADPAVASPPDPAVRDALARF